MNTRLCDQLAKKGTGLGICNTRLDEHGNCPNAAKHLEDEFQGCDPYGLAQNA